MKLFVFIFSFAFCFPISGADSGITADIKPTPSATQSIYSPIEIANIVQMAQQQGLWEDPYWQVLLHFSRHGFFFKGQSRVDDPRFFCILMGKTIRKRNC